MNILLFIVINIVVILSFAYLSYYIINNNHKKDPHDSKSFYKFLVGEKISFKDLLTGLSFGIIFGFLDNFGLLIGISEITKNLPISNLAKSAIGNTYSDFLGASVGTFISIILKSYTNYDDSGKPFWLNMVGITSGCILGYFIPTFFYKF